MPEYYAIERSSEYLKHYGIRGMKWGIRRAIRVAANGDKEKASKMMKKAYNKAALKLAKLSINANRGVMEQRYKKAKSRMINGAISSAGMSAGLTAGLNSARGVSLGNTVKSAAIAGGAGALGGALINSNGILSKRYISDKGHAKAISKRDSWRKSMESSFELNKKGGEEYRRLNDQLVSLSNNPDPLKYIQKQYTKSLNSNGISQRRRKR